MRLLTPDAPLGNPAFALSQDQIATVLDLICRGAREAHGSLEPGMLEVPISVVVRKAMRRVKKEMSLTNLQIRGEHELENMATADASILGRIDVTLQFLHQFGDEDAYVAIECKRVAVGNNTLNARYVTEGVARFVDGKYAASHEWGFMLGYVLSEPPAQPIIDFIDARIQAAYGNACAFGQWGTHGLALSLMHNVVVQPHDHPIQLVHVFVDMLPAAAS